MLKFIKPHSKVVSPERLQKQKELFGFSESCFHGFPSKPSAIAYDSKLSLLALANKNGSIRIYGQPGVEFYGQHENSDVPINRLCFLPGQGALVSLCEDNSLHLWKIQEDGGCWSLNSVKTASLEGKLKKISMIVPDGECKNLLIGTEGGNIYLLDLASFNMTSDIIYQDVVMQNVPENYKVNPGPVEAIAPHPILTNKILIGYQRGLIVLWDRKQPCAEQTYISNQQLESLCWNDEATEFVSSHNDGSQVIWSILDSSKYKEDPKTVYGPFPCKPINNIVWRGAKEPFMIFSGGMARASHGDRNTITAMQGEEHVTFSFTSRIIDFVVTENNETGGPSTLIALAEEEIVFIDLESEGWPVFKNPYLSSLHSSAITCSYFVSNVNKQVFDKLKTVGDDQHSDLSKRPWPINGGKNLSTPPSQTDILVTGHEDGTVRFWDASATCLSLLYKLTTEPMFLSEDFGGDAANAEEDDWPPFRKVGLFDPYSDDPRLGIKKLEMCSLTGQLVVAGTAGQIIILEISPEDKELTLQYVDVNLVAENDSFVWKSHSKLDPQKESVKFKRGFHPLVVVQFYPPAACTSLNLHSEWGLVAAGTAHGFCLFDYLTKKSLLARSTLSPLDLANAADEGPMSRRRSLKKSLRESFRRLRKGRSQRKPAKPKDPIVSPPNPAVKSTPAEEDGVKPVERAIEARSHSADYIGSMVRCLCFTKCYIATTHSMSATLWAGTNSGKIFIYTIFVPPSEMRLQTPLTVQLGKEIHLKHGAPVVGVMVLDGLNNPFPEPMAVKRGTSPPPNTNSGHRVLISSEEQFKVFTLPQLKPFCKYKLTAHEGSRVRKLGTSEFTSTSDKDYKETCFTVVTNIGDVSVYSLPGARKQIQMQCLRKEDISGINSIVFTKRGEALYLVSASELARISLSANHITTPLCSINTTEPCTIIEACEEAAPVAPVTSSGECPPPLPPVVKLTPDDDVATPAIAAAIAVPMKKLEESIENCGDVSVFSGDITIDSIRDHMDEMKTAEKVIEVAVSSTPDSGALTTTTVSVVKEESSTTKSSSVTVVKTSNVTVVSSQEGSVDPAAIQVVETTSPEENTNVNGTEQ